MKFTLKYIACSGGGRYKELGSRLCNSKSVLSMLLLGGSGGMPPRKILKNKTSEIASESILINKTSYVAI